MISDQSFALAEVRTQNFPVPFLLGELASMNKWHTVPSGAGAAEKAALTGRERQIIRLVSEGLSNKQIARRLNITDGTIKVHLHSIFEKLRVGQPDNARGGLSL